MKTRTFLAWIALYASVFATVAAFADNSISLRVVQFGEYTVGISEDYRVFAITCSGGWARNYKATVYMQNNEGDLVFKRETSFKTVVPVVPPQVSPARAVVQGAANICSKGPGFYDLVDKGDHFDIVSTGYPAYETYPQETTLRTFRVGKYLAGITDNHRMVGIVCDSQQGGIHFVRENGVGRLNVNTYDGRGRANFEMYPYQVVTGQGTEALCSGGTGTFAAVLGQSRQAELQGALQMNARLPRWRHAR